MLHVGATPVLRYSAARVPADTPRLRPIMRFRSVKQSLPNIYTTVVVWSTSPQEFIVNCHVTD